MNMMRQLRRRQAKSTAREEATRLVLDRWAEFCKQADTVILYTLCMDEHYGKKRAERFYFRMLENQIRMIEQFRTDKDDDETYYLVMAERIRQHGIDIDALLAEADRIRSPECDYEERQRMIKEYQARGKSDDNGRS